MQEKIAAINDLIINGKIEEATLSLRNVFSLSESEFVNDVHMLNAQFRKLQSDKRKGILSYEQENISHNKIIDGLLSLVKELKNHESDYLRYDQIGQNIEAAAQKFNINIPFHFQQSLINRLARIKVLDIKFTALWVDDNPQYNMHEQQIIEAIGVQLLLAESSTEALLMLQSGGEVDLLLSDVSRGMKRREGFNFVKKLSDQGIELAVIFYTLRHDRKLGLPAHTFGLAVRPDELLHLVMDAIERKY